MFYSPSTGGFYPEESGVYGDRFIEVDGEQQNNPDFLIPADAVEITEELFNTLRAGEAEGKVIIAGKGGKPKLSDRPGMTREEVDSARLRAFADPLKGSDRYYSESVAEEDNGNPEAAQKCRALAKARRAEIQAQYPWPEEK